MKTRATTAIIAALFVGHSSVFASDMTPAVVTNGMLTGPNGMTLYTFDKDTPNSGKSVCNGPCATNWPPRMASDSDTNQAEYTVITRDDGKKQWAFKGQPLYYWIKDAKPGDTSGDGVGQVWHTAKP